MHNLPKLVPRHQVTKVSDVVSVGQQLSLMCIGQDLRGNIKLSLKATLQHQGTGTSEVARASMDVPKQMPPGPASDGANQQKKTTNAVEVLHADKSEISGSTSSFSSSPAIVIRSAVECDEEEKLALSSASSKTSPKLPSVSKSGHKLKTVASNDNGLGSKFPDSGSKIAKNVKPYSEKERKKEPKFNFVSESEDDTAGVSLNVKRLKIGTKVTAKVHQIRARGLVLHLGGAIHGMYRFESGGRRDFEVGDEVQVECSSFTAKGIPVVSMVQDE